MEIKSPTFSTIDGEFTIGGEAKKLTFEFNFEGMQLHDITSIASRMLKTDIQNTTRKNDGDSAEKAKSKQDKLKGMLTEQEANGKVKIMVKDLKKRMALATLSAEEQIDSMSNERLEALMAMIASKLGKKPEN